MSTCPTTSPDSIVKPCYTCAHLYDVTPLGNAVCARERHTIGSMSVQSDPQGGCVYWRLDPARPTIANHAEWVALHGQGMQGFSERSDTVFRAPLTAREARAAADRGDPEDARALGWELARHHELLRRIVDALWHVSMRITLDTMRADLALLRELLAKEHSVAAHLQRQAAQKERRRR